MQTYNLIQGSIEWHQLRQSVDGTASEAPAMMGASKYQKRDELLKAKTTAVVQEISGAQQALFDRGHAAEASIRPHVEQMIGEELYPVTGSIEIDGLHLLASFDGIDMMEQICFEHKLWAEGLAESVRNKDLDPHYYWQLEQQLLVSGAEKVIFVVSDGTPEKMVWMEYFPVAGRREQLIAGWKQFNADRASYVAPEAKPEAVAEEVEFLPAIDIRAQGQISVIHNLDVFEQKLSTFLSEKLIREPQSDNDFATLDLQIKAMKDAEEKLKLAGNSILAQIQAVDTAMSKKNSLQEIVRQNRLMAEKLLASEKEARKNEIVNSAKRALVDHIATCNKALAETGTKVLMPEIAVDFLGAAKNKRTLDSLRSACNDELARGKIEANRVLNHIDQNLELLRSLAANHKFLFADIQQLVLKDKDALEAITKQRISEHEAAAEKKRAEAEAQRIANELAEKERQQVVVTQPVLEQVVHANEDENLAAVAEYEQMNAVIPEQPAAQTVSNFATSRPAPNFDAPEAIADMSEFISGKHAAFKIALDRFLECKKSGADFEQVLQSLIHSTQPVHKAA